MLEENRMRNHYIPVRVCFILMLAGSCTPDNEIFLPSGLAYYPLRGGDYRIYSVSETIITPYNVEAKLAYEVKTIVTDSFQNVEGKYSYIISRFKRKSTTEVWSSLDTWTARHNDKEVVVAEGNIPYVKLTMPVITNRQWNGNAYNNEESNEFCLSSEFTSCDTYAFGDVAKAYTTSKGLIFDNSIEVIENDDPDIFTEHDVRKSIYAWQVGLVAREIVVLKYCTAGSCYGKQLIESGRKVKWELTSYGHQ